MPIGSPDAHVFFMPVSFREVDGTCEAQVVKRVKAFYRMQLIDAVDRHSFAESKIGNSQLL